MVETNTQYCPYCTQEHYNVSKSTKLIKCRRCGRHFTPVPQEPPSIMPPDASNFTNNFACPRCYSKEITMIFTMWPPDIRPKRPTALRYRCICEEVFTLRYRVGDWYRRRQKWER